MSLRRQTLLLACMLPLAACNDTAPNAPEVRAVRTVVIDPKPLDDDRRSVGEIKPRYESELGFRVAGKMVARSVDVGAAVRKGDVLARLEEQDYRNKLKSAEADLAAAEAVLVEAQSTEERQRQLLTTGTTTRALYDSALKNFRSAEARRDQALTSVELARDQLAYTELHAEFDGVVTAVGAEAGQVVNSGHMIVRVARPNDKDAVFAVAEAAFRLGSERREPSRVVVLLLSNAAVTAEGVVREISPIADPATRTYQVKVTLADAPEQMRFGGSVVGRIKASTTPVVVLPGSALFDKNGTPAVWIVDPVGQSVQLKTVSVERYETDRVILKEGLNKGDIVVTAGVNRLRDGQKVRLAGGDA
ncbi:efflux RND transporter periplasmic adaptor subunit [Bradyrhizobium vignae]|uniref:Efflux RND transporter periplasmic adaptor subunit n=2 Tax=Bradyrhizobium vignae TaxID=1549949 RepID=A0ABS3ZR63_9BRAD|nr:efflux RND transporter periplasmic adaptor subunit [Bradyrhizobium vignae]